LTRSVRVKLGALASSALAEAEGKEGREGEAIPQATADDLLTAIRFYLKDKGTDSPSWTYPRFLPGIPAGKQVELVLDIDEGIWESLEREAEDQETSPVELIEHVALYYAAEVHSGRAALRIFDWIEEGK
jgi:hypothetical protein